MPRVKIDVSYEWLERLQRVVPAAIDTLTGWEAQLDQHYIDGKYRSEDLLDQLHSQIVDLRRSIEAVRIIF